MQSPGPFTPGNDRLPIVYEANMVPGTAWTDAGNFAPIGIQFPYRAASSESLYHWTIPAHICTISKSTIIYSYLIT